MDQEKFKPIAEGAGLDASDQRVEDVEEARAMAEGGNKKEAEAAWFEGRANLSLDAIERWKALYEVHNPDHEGGYATYFSDRVKEQEFKKGEEELVEELAEKMVEMGVTKEKDLGFARAFLPREGRGRYWVDSTEADIEETLKGMKSSQEAADYRETIGRVIHHHPEVQLSEDMAKNVEDIVNARESLQKLRFVVQCCEDKLKYFDLFDRNDGGPDSNEPWNAAWMVEPTRHKLIKSLEPLIAALSFSGKEAEHAQECYDKYKVMMNDRDYRGQSYEFRLLVTEIQHVAEHEIQEYEEKYGPILAELTN